MNELILFTVIVSSMLPIGYLGLKIVFKKSIIFSLSWLNLIIVYFSSLIYFTVGRLGLIHLVWAIPVACMITGGFYLRIKAKVQKPLLDTISHLNKIAEGDLQIENVKGIEHQDNELGMITNNIQKLVFVLRHLVKEMNKGSRKLSKSSSLLANNIHNLARDSAQQANSSEYIANTMESIAKSVGENTSYARESNELSQENMASLRELFEISAKITGMVEAISSGTKEIDDIAKGTNILALNAAIEAAKSGAAGKGFTVVAHEIRKLAERSKDTVSQITKLSKDSKKLVERSSGLFDHMLPQIEKTSEMVAEISNASVKQQVSVEQVNSSIKELHEIAQNNVEASEEIAFTSEQLKDLSDSLKDSLHFFKTSNPAAKERMENVKMAKEKQKMKNNILEKKQSA
ncbi:methyl-accepting chemotaxis protein [Saccharicrinis sp. 156]|uniref:methyl-accepting chemotaxis protein n=1 Tax=Saccharicrinis sp. 156 TaxID=3417574 RepID=UPI003D34D64C